MSQMALVTFYDRIIQFVEQTNQFVYILLNPKLIVELVVGDWSRWTSPAIQKPLGQSVTDLFWQLSGMDEVFAELLSGQSQSFTIPQVNYIRSDGSVEYATIRIEPLNTREPAEGLILILSDTTDAGKLLQALVQDRNELRLLQAQLAKANRELHYTNQLKSLFFSMAAHDLRTPLTAIQGYANLILSETIDPTDNQRFLKTIINQTSMLGHLISNLLDLNKIDQGKLTIDKAWCDLNEIIKEVVSLNQLSIDLVQINMELNLPEKSVDVLGDYNRLHQIIHNVLTNAIKYSDEGDTITIMATQKEEEVLVQIGDTGQGMTEEQLAHIFDLYYRTDTAEQSKVKGTGLGLYIVKQLMNAHDGRIEVKSKVNAGTTFSLFFPTVTAPSPANSENHD